MSSLPAPFKTGTSNKAHDSPWAIAYHQNDQSNKQRIDKLSNNFTIYNRTRRWGRGCAPLQDQKMLGVDYDGLDSLRDEFRASKCKVIMVIIPDNEE